MWLKDRDTLFWRSLKTSCNPINWIIRFYLPSRWQLPPTAPPQGLKGIYCPSCAQGQFLCFCSGLIPASLLLPQLPITHKKLLLLGAQTFSVLLVTAPMSPLRPCEDTALPLALFSKAQGRSFPNSPLHDWGQAVMSNRCSSGRNQRVKVWLERIPSLSKVFLVFLTLNKPE